MSTPLEEAAIRAQRALTAAPVDHLPPPFALARLVADLLIIGTANGIHVRDMVEKATEIHDSEIP